MLKAGFPAPVAPLEDGGTFWRGFVEENWVTGVPLKGLLATGLSLCFLAAVKQRALPTVPSSP